MSQSLLLQYIIKNKPKDKDDNAAGTTSMHVGETTLDKDKTIAPSDSSNSGTHVYNVTEPLSYHHNMYKIFLHQIQLTIKYGIEPTHVVSQLTL